MRVPSLKSAQALPLPRWGEIQGTARAFGWQRGAISGIVLLTSSIIGYQAYERWGPAEATPAPTVQTATAARRSIVERASLPGTVGAARQARMAFASTTTGTNLSGRVESISVKTGDTVKIGQELARMNTTSLDLSVQSAESALLVAQLRMQQLIAGALPQEVATLQQSVINVSSTLARAENDLKTLVDGPTPADIASATQTYLTAQNSLTTAQASLDAIQMRASAASQIVPTQTSLDQMNAQRLRAQSDIDAALATVDSRQMPQITHSALTDLLNLVRGRCGLLGNRDQCATLAMSATGMTELVTSINTRTATRPTDFGPSLVRYTEAVSSAAYASLLQAAFQLVQAEAALPGLASRVNDLVQAQSGSSGFPTNDAVTSAQRTRDAAKQGLITAREKLDKLVAGPTTTDALIGRNAVEAARAALTSATVKRDEALGGPLPLDLAIQEQSLRQATVNMRKAIDERVGAVIVAPFDGVVGTITMNVGEATGSGAIILIDPLSMQLNATSQEADVGRLKVGQNVSLTFDAYRGPIVTGRIASVAPAAEVTQGVPSYAVVVEVTRGVQGAQRTSTVNLLAGMAGSASVEINRNDNVLAVPSRAVRRQGRGQVIEVMVNGKPEMRTVRSGVSDGTFTQILEGIAEGDIVTIPTAVTTTSAVGTGGQQQGAPGVIVVPGKAQ